MSKKNDALKRIAINTSIIAGICLCPPNKNGFGNDIRKNNKNEVNSKVLNEIIINSASLIYSECCVYANHQYNAYSNYSNYARSYNYARYGIFFYYGQYCEYSNYGKCLTCNDSINKFSYIKENDNYTNYSRSK